MKNLILIGGGGHCKSCIDVIEGINDYKIIGILDTQDKVGQRVLGYEIIGTDDDIEKFAKDGCQFLITVGQIETAELRKELFERVKNVNGKLATIIASDSYVSKHARIGEGTIVMHGVIINAGANIGNNCIVNTKSLVEHDCIVEDNCHIAVAAVLAGGVKLGCCSFVGANATIVQYLDLPEDSFIKAGSIVKR